MPGGWVERASRAHGRRAVVCIMGNPLEVIRQELAALRPRVKVLEQAEELLASSYEPPASTRSSGRPQEPKAPRPSKTAGGNPSRSEIIEHLIAHGPATRGELLASLGGSPHAMSAKLKYLLAAGSIAASGQPGARRYYVSGRAAAASELPASPGRPPERGVYEVYDAIVDTGGATTAQLMKLTGLSKSVVIEQGRRLTRLRLVRFTDKGADRVWLPRLPSGGAR
jgi:hypothetical protein